MKKSLFLLLVIFLISQCYCQDGFDFLDYGDCYKEDVSKVKDCEGLSVGSSYYKCCLLESEGKINGEKKKEKVCEPVTEDNYKNIKDFIKTRKKLAEGLGAKDVKLSIDCRSNYIFISIVSLISLLL